MEGPSVFTKVREKLQLIEDFRVNFHQAMFRLFPAKHNVDEEGRNIVIQEEEQPKVCIRRSHCDGRIPEHVLHGMFPECFDTCIDEVNCGRKSVLKEEKEI
jgi:hypothetical protein